MSTTGQDSRAPGYRIIDVGGDRGQLLRRDQGTHVGPPPHTHLQPHRAHPFDEPGHEPVIDVGVHVHAFHRDAQLPGVGEACAQCSLAGPLHIDIGANDHRVLAAELQRASDQLLPALGRDQPPDAGGTGEHDVVGLPYQCGTQYLALTGHDVQHPAWQSRAVQQMQHPQGRDRGLGVRFDDDGVAGQQRRDRVGHRQRERVVPGGDDAHDSLGMVVNLDGHRTGERTADPARLEQSDCVAGVVARLRTDIQQFFQSVLAGFSGLPLDDVQTLVATAEHQIVERQKDACPFRHRNRRPALLRGPGEPEGRRHICGVGLGNPSDLGAVDG